MSHPNYTLEVISHHPKSNGKSLRKYDVEGIETIGVWGDEPFSIVFKNHGWQKVQVKLSIDGTDIMTGRPADTQVSDKMWVVNGYDTLTLKAWPECDDGGAAFVFTSADNSVAVHTHGNLSSRGIIAAAVFTEGHVEPVRVQQDHHHHWHSYPYYVPITIPSYEWIWYNTIGYNTAGPICGNASYSSFVCTNSLSGDISGSTTINNVSDTQPTKSLESLVAVGAGNYTAQKITHVAGLIKPLFSETVRVKYMWYDDLVEKLRTHSVAQPQPSGFPGDVGKKNIDLKGTPRLGGKQVVQPTQQVFDRF